jgi:hypothetical protein
MTLAAPQAQDASWLPDDPCQVAVREAERSLDVRQGDVDDGPVEHDHELCRRDDGERQAQPPLRSA